jgi:polysaccharide export outer membrane protein
MKTKTIVRHLARLQFTAVIFAIGFLFFAGCATSHSDFGQNPALPQKDSKDIVLSESDVLKIAFPGASNLDTVQTIRRDGKITLPIIGEVVASGKTPPELQKELVNLYTNQLVSAQDIIVTVQSSSFRVFVTGAVAKPGSVASDQPITVLQAIMQSGGPDYKRANLKAVRIIRNTESGTKNFTVNLKGIENGSSIDVFYLQPSDIIYVPEKITWF